MCADRDRVEPGERLVEHEQLGLVDERRDQLDALLVAVRQRVEAVVRPIGEAEPFEPAVDAAATSSARPPHSRPRYTSWSRTCMRGYRPRSSGMYPNRGALQRDRRAAPSHGAGVQFDQTEHGPHRRRLSRAVRAEESRQAGRMRGERASVKRGQSPKALADTIELKHTGHLPGSSLVPTTPAI